MRPPAVASGYGRKVQRVVVAVVVTSMRPPAVASGYMIQDSVFDIQGYVTSMRPPAVASGYGPTASTRHGSACASFCERSLITTIPGLQGSLQHAAGAVTTSALARRRRALCPSRAPGPWTRTGPALVPFYAAACWSSRSRAAWICWAPCRVHGAPVRVRCPSALSWSATLAHDRPPRRCPMMPARMSCSPA